MSLMKKLKKNVNKKNNFARGQNSNIGTVPFSMHRNRPVQSGASNFQSAARYPFALVLGGILYTKTSFLMRRALSTSSILVYVYWNRKYRIVRSLMYIRLVCFVVAEIFLSHFHSSSKIIQNLSRCLDDVSLCL